ncbi:hypothetical protein V3C99_010212, partial [Haemonchus contortus]
DVFRRRLVCNHRSCSRTTIVPNTPRKHSAYSWTRACGSVRTLSTSPRTRACDSVRKLSTSPRTSAYDSLRKLSASACSVARNNSYFRESSLWDVIDQTGLSMGIYQ